MDQYSGLHASLIEFLDSFRENGTETDLSFSVSLDQIAEDELINFIDSIEQLSGEIDTGNIIFQIDGADDSYRVRYNPRTGSIEGERIRGEYEIESQYSHDPDLVESLQRIESDIISDASELRRDIENILGEQSIQVDIEYNLQKEYIKSKLEEELPRDDISVNIYFQFDYFQSNLRDIPPRDIRGFLLNPGDVKSLVIIFDLDSFLSGPGLAISDLLHLKLDSFLEAPPGWVDHFESVRTQALIENPESNYLPPSFFQFTEGMSSNRKEEVQRMFSKCVVLFSILSISSSSELIDSGWKVRMTGRQYIEGVLEFPDDRTITIQSDEIEHSRELTPDLVKGVYSLFEWIYCSEEVQDRITVFRNVATTTTHSVEGILSNSVELLESAKANRKYFLEQSVDDFFEFRQELIQGAFKTQRVFSDLRTELMHELTRDLFRTFGFILIFAATLFFELETVLPVEIAYNIIGILVLIYGLIIIRRISGIKRNLDTAIENRNNYIKYYSKFFDKSELAEIGIMDSRNPSIVCTICEILYKKRGELHKNPTQCNLYFDIAIYYVLAAAVILGSAILLIDINFYDLFTSVP